MKEVREIGVRVMQPNANGIVAYGLDEIDITGRWRLEWNGLPNDPQMAIEVRPLRGVPILWVPEEYITFWDRVTFEPAS